MAGLRSLDNALSDSQRMPTTLATRCPYCHTQFRVTPQQLALREGMVRCGTCREVFNGTDHLSESPSEHDFALGSPGDVTPEADLLFRNDDEAAGRMTLFDLGTQSGAAVPNDSTMQEELDALSKAIAELQNKPWSEPASGGLLQPAAADDDEHEDSAPGFVQEGRQRQRTGRLWKFLLMLVMPLLVLGLITQLSYLLRNEIAAHSPEAAHYLRAACRRIGCTITLPAQIEALSIESRQLQAMPDQANHFELVILLRNVSTTSQTWPALDLQLNDAIGQAEIRKIFRPADFLKASEIRTGIPAASEREIRLRFELSGDPAYGFNIRIFHP